MAEQGAISWQVLAYLPGNPDLPVLPDPGDPTIGGLALASFADADFLLDEHILVDAGGASGGVGFADWYLDTIWISPVPVDFASITADVQRALNIHNTYRSAVSLNDIDTSLVDGISSTDPSLPEGIDSFSSITATLVAAEEGPSSFNDFIDFVFSTETIPVRVFGQRILIFNIVPQRGITEQLRYKTDLMRAESGKEQAMAGRACARRELRLDVRFADDTERQRVHNMLLGGGANLPFGVQQWQESRALTTAAVDTDTEIFVDTVYLTYEAGRQVSFVLPDNTSIEAEIDEVQADRLVLVNAIGIVLPAGTYAMPILEGRLSGPVRLAVWPVVAEDFQIQFTITNTPWVGAVPALITDPHPIDGLPILSGDNILPNDTKEASIDRVDTRLDSQTGVIGISGTEPIGIYGSAWLAAAITPEEVYAWRQFADYLFGSWGRFYMPTYQNDLPIDGTLDATAGTFDIPNLGLRRFLNARAPRRDIRIETPEGVDYRRITSVTDNGATEEVTLNAVTSNASGHAAADVKISWLTLSRIAGDSVTFQHIRRGEADVLFNVRSVTE